MTARLVFLGRLADLADAPELAVEPGPLPELLAGLPPALAITLLDERVRIAINGALVNQPEALMVEPGDEVAFLPPVSGG